MLSLKNISDKLIVRVKQFYAINKTKRARFQYGIEVNSKRNDKIIVSMTSYFNRFPTLALCLKTILCQTVKPDKIILYLTRDDEKRLPPEIQNLKKYGLDILITDEDIKPHKKYYYAMKDFPNDIIITVDDDIIYDRRLIEKLLATHEKFPNYVIAGRAKKIDWTQKRFKKYEDWALYDKEDTPSINLLATGVGGILYPKNSKMRGEMTNRDKIKEYVSVDDLWLKAIEIINNVPTVLCDQIVEKRRIEIPSAQKNGLAQVNVALKNNDKYWAKLEDEYNLLDRIKK